MKRANHYAVLPLLLVAGWAAAQSINGVGEGGLSTSTGLTLDSTTQDFPADKAVTLGGGANGLSLNGVHIDGTVGEGLTIGPTANAGSELQVDNSNQSAQGPPVRLIDNRNSNSATIMVIRSTDTHDGTVENFGWSGITTGSGADAGKTFGSFGLDFVTHNDATSAARFIWKQLVANVLTVSAILDATGLTLAGKLTAVGVAVGGPLTTATTGAFSGAVSAASLALSGALTGATTGSFSSTLAAVGFNNTGTNNTSGSTSTNITTSNVTATGSVDTFHLLKAATGAALTDNVVCWGYTDTSTPFCLLGAAGNTLGTDYKLTSPGLLSIAPATTLYLSSTSLPVQVTGGLTVLTGGNLAVSNGTATLGGAVTAQSTLAVSSTTTMSGSLTFSNVATDMTTGTNETLLISPNGTGITSIKRPTSTSVTLDTCAVAFEGTVERDVLAGVATGARTRLCVCTSAGASDYAWQNVVTGTVGTSTTCSP